MIQVEDDVRVYVNQNGGAVTIDHSQQTAMCCGSINFGPTVRLGAPADDSAYHKLCINEVVVYLPEDFLTPYPLQLTLRSTLGFKRVCIEGWKVL